MLRELLVGFGIEVNGKEKLQEVSDSLAGIKKVATIVGSLLASAFVIRGIAEFITNQIEVGRNLSVTAEKLGVTTDELEKFDFAAEQSGASAEQAQKGLGFFNRIIGDAEAGSKSATKVLGQFTGGLRDAKGHVLPLNDALGIVADKIANMTDRAQKTNLARKLFGRGGDALIPLLDQGSKGIAELSKMFDDMGGGIGGEFAEDARKAGNELKKLDFVFTVLKTRIVNAVLPAFVSFVTWLIEMTTQLSWLARHSYAAQTAIIALGAVAVAALLPFLLTIAPIVAACGALYLIFDDLFTLFMGGDSLTGRILDNLFGIGTSKKFVAELKDEVAALWGHFKELLPLIEQVGGALILAFSGGIGVAITGVLKGIILIISTVTAAIRAANALAHGDLAGAGAIIDDAGDLVTGGKGGNEDREKNKQRDAQNQDASDAEGAEAAGHALFNVDGGKGTGGGFVPFRPGAFIPAVHPYEPSAILPNPAGAGGNGIGGGAPVVNNISVVVKGDATKETADEIAHKVVHSQNKRALNAQPVRP